MKRRNFIGTLTLAAGAACVPRPASGESPYLEDHSHNWWAWRETWKQVAENGNRVRWCELEQERNGYRKARVHVVDDETGVERTLTWMQPWTRDTHWRENLNRNFTPCSDCGAKTYEQHHHACKSATHLAAKLGSELDGFRA